MAVPAFLLDLNVLSIIAFLVLLALVTWRDRANIERHSVVFVRRTKHGIEVLDRVASWRPRTWRVWATVGVVAGFLGMAGLFVLLIQQTLRLFLVGGAAPPVGPVLPTVSTVTNPAQAGYLGLPFWHFMIGLSVVMVAHEMMHGVIARVEGFDIEYVGLILLGIIPGAFVQPKGQRDFFDSSNSERSLDRANPEDSSRPEPEDAETEEPWGTGSPMARLRVLAAGPFANITLALVLAVVLMGAFTSAHGTTELRGFYDHSGMEIVNVTDGSPAEAAGLEPGMTITALDGNGTLDIAGFERATRNLTVGENVTVETAGNGTFTVTLGERPEEDGNYTFTPAPVDYVLPHLERAAPGSIAFYEDHNDWLVGKTPDIRRARWSWLAERNPALAGTAAERIAALEADEPVQDEGFMGIVVVAQVDVKAGLERYAGPLLLLFQVVFFVALLNLMIGIANLLPVRGLDGGWMLDTAMDAYGPDWGAAVTRYATITTLAVIGISFAFLIGRALV